MLKLSPYVHYQFTANFTITSCSTRAVSTKIFRGRGGFDINIHFRYTKIFEVNFFEVVYITLTLFGINITMLVKFFSLSLLPLFSGAPKIWKSGAKPGFWWRSPQPPTDFYGFYIKNTHLSTLFIEKGRTAPAVSAVSNTQ